MMKYSNFRQRLIQVLLTSNTPGVASFLKTTCEGSFCIADLIPHLGDRYPNSTVELSISASRAPAMLFSEKNGGKLKIIAIQKIMKKEHLETVKMILNLARNKSPMQISTVSRSFKSTPKQKCFDKNFAQEKDILQLRFHKN